MRSRASHELDAVPVLTSTIAVALDVADEFAVGLAGSIKTEAGLYLVILQVTIDGLGATDYLHAIILGSIILSQYACVGIGVITTDDYQCLDAQLAQNLYAALKLALLLQLGTSGADDIKTTSIAIFIDKLIIEFHIFVVNQTARTHQETIELAVGIQTLDTVIQTAYHIMATRSLTARKDNTYIDSIHRLLLSLLKGDYGHTVSVGEHGLNLLLVTHALSGLALYSDYRTLQCLGKFGLIGGSCHL